VIVARTLPGQANTLDAVALSFAVGYGGYQRELSHHLRHRRR
jgi:hypothetical protein